MSRSQRWVKLMESIFELKVGDSITVEGGKKDRILIRSGLLDPARYAYRGTGVYKTKSVGENLIITRVKMF